MSDAKNRTLGSRDQCTPDQQRCWDLLNHWHGVHRFRKVVECGRGIAVTMTGELSTHDWNQLTTLVLLSHAMRVRVGISSAMRQIRITLHARECSGTTTVRHPGLDDLARQIDDTKRHCEPLIYHSPDATPWQQTDGWEGKR